METIISLKTGPTRERWENAITLEEHLTIVRCERNAELKAFYELLWHLGAAQSDLASLKAEDENWQEHTAAFRRHKTKVPVVITIGEEASAILKTRPRSGFLFSWLSQLHEKHRAKHFSKRLAPVGISGVSLQSYRYAWAERAKIVG